MDLFQRFIFGGGTTGTPPTVNLLWDDTETSEDRVTTHAPWGYNIHVVASDVDSDIIKVEIQYSLNSGSTWQVLLNNLYPSVMFSDILYINQNKWYRAIVYDSEGNSVVSNILKYQYLVQPTYYSFTLGTDSQHYDPRDACLWQYINDPVTVYASTPNLIEGVTILYEDTALTLPYNGNGFFEFCQGLAVEVNPDGLCNEVHDCSSFNP